MSVPGFKIGLAVLIQYRRVRTAIHYSHPATSPQQVRAHAMHISPGAEGGPVCNHMSPNFDS